MTMIEKVARAMAEKHECFFGPDDLVSLMVPFTPSSMSLMARGIHRKLDDGAYLPFWEIFVPEARTAIEAMRTPTIEMKIGGHERIPVDNPAPLDAQHIWSAMIDKALSE